MAESNEIRIEAGESTEDVLQSIIAELDDETLETVDVRRETSQAEGMASEPITTAVVLVSLGGAAIYAIARGIEKHLENKRQADARRIALKAVGISAEAGKQIIELEEKHSDVIQSFGIPRLRPHDTSIKGMDLEIK